MKFCHGCGQWAEFHRNAARKDGLATQCKGCMAGHSKRWYEGNRQRHLENTKRNNAKRYHKRRRYWLDKLGGVCVECGGTDRLEFDHVEESNKNFEIVHLLTSYSEDAVAAEMKLCQLLCISCHRRKTMDWRWHRKVVMPYVPS